MRCLCIRDRYNQSQRAAYRGQRQLSIRDRAKEDGCRYRTHKLTACPIGFSFDPVRALKMQISTYLREGNNELHRKAERELRAILEDERFMKKLREGGYESD